MGRKRRKNVNKQSMYNIVQPLESGALLVYNTFSEAMVTMRKDYYEQYVERCEEGEDTKRLLEMGFITDSSVDEYFRVLCNKRTVKYTGDKKISNIKVMVTSGCNARCWYCFEKNIQKKRMTNETVDAFIAFLLKYGDKNGLHIAWFGGEPTLEKNTIEKVSEALLENGFKITCSIVTNGYLFTEDFIQVLLKYNLNHVQITLDGLQDEYNKVKNYAVADENPFQTVIENIRVATNYNFHTSIRLNFCKSNVQDIKAIISFLYETFGNKIGVYVAPITGVKDDLHTIGDAYLVLFEKLLECGYITKLSQAHLQAIPIYCGAEIMNFYTVTPDGYLYKCSQEVSAKTHHRAVGNIYTGPVINEVLKEWLDEENVEECKACKLLPVCQQGCRGYRLGIESLDYSCIPTKYIFGDIIKKMYQLKKK